LLGWTALVLQVHPILAYALLPEGTRDQGSLKVEDKYIGVLPHELPFFIVDLLESGILPLIGDHCGGFLYLRNDFFFCCFVSEGSCCQTKAKQHCQCDSYYSSHVLLLFFG
jgi:hypothetical protein